METKTCKICKEKKSILMFRIRNKVNGLRRTECSCCLDIKRKNYYQKDPDYAKNYQKQKRALIKEGNFVPKKVIQIDENSTKVCNQCKIEKNVMKDFFKELK
jgi:hypothetical protein